MPPPAPASFAHGHGHSAVPRVERLADDGLAARNGSGQGGVRADGSRGGRWTTARTSARAGGLDDEDEDSIEEADSLEVPVRTGMQCTVLEPPLFLLPRPRQSQAQSQRSSSSRSTRPPSSSSSAPSFLLPPPSQPSQSSSSRSASGNSRQQRAIGVPRPPTSRKSRLSFAVSSSSSSLTGPADTGRSGALRETQARSPASSQELVVEEQRPKKPRRSTTPTLSPPASASQASFFLPPPSALPSASSSVASQKREKRPALTAALPSRPPSQLQPEQKRSRRSTTPTLSPPPSSSQPVPALPFLLPPPSQSQRSKSARGHSQRSVPARRMDEAKREAREPPRVRVEQETKREEPPERERREPKEGRKLGPVPVMPPSSFRPREEARQKTEPVIVEAADKAADKGAVGSTEDGIMATQLSETKPSPSRKRPRPRTPSPPPASVPQRFPPTLLTSLSTLTSQLPTLDPKHSYGLQSSLLFRLEYIERGAPSYEQGACKEALKAERAVAKKRKAKEAEAGEGKESREERERVPSWARTSDGGEWDAALLASLSAQLARPPRRGQAADEGEDELAPLLWARDVPRLRRVRLGEGGGCEVYLVQTGREEGKGEGEVPCRYVRVTGWVAQREWREKEGAWEYTIDDGTALLSVFFTSPSPDASASPSSSKLRASPPRHLPALPSQLPSATAEEEEMAALRERHAPASEVREDAERLASVGELVRLLGRVEEGRFEWEGRRVVGIRMEPVPLHAEPAHHAAVARLHREVYSQPFDLKAKLDELERKARERKWEAEASFLSSTAGGSSYAGGMSSCGGSPGKVRYRPTRPSKLSREDLTLPNFLFYVRHHVEKNYVKKSFISDAEEPASLYELPPSAQPSSSSFLPSDDDQAASSGEVVYWAKPFTLSGLRSNAHLALFATRYAQKLATEQQARDAERKSRRARLGPLGAAISSSSSSAAAPAPARMKGMLPPPSSAAETREQRRERREKERRGLREGPLSGAELEKAVDRVWKDAIRKWRAEGGCVEAEELPVKAAPPEMDWDEEEEEELPDLPSYRGAAGAAGRSRSRRDAPSPLKKRKTAAGQTQVGCPWGDVLELSSDEDEEGGKTPRASTTAAKGKKEGKGGCPWGDVKLFSSSPSKSGDEDGSKTPSARHPAPVSPSPSPIVPSSRTPRRAPPPSFGMPKDFASRRPAASASFANTSFALSNASILTTGSLDASPGGTREPEFQLVSALTLSSLILSLIQTLYESHGDGSSVTEREVRERMRLDERWAMVAERSEAVTDAILLLVEEEKVEKYGQGVRPAGAGGRRGRGRR